jgi:hypothetical protein
VPGDPSQPLTWVFGERANGVLRGCLLRGLTTGHKQLASDPCYGSGPKRVGHSAIGNSPALRDWTAPVILEARTLGGCRVMPTQRIRAREGKGHGELAGWLAGWLEAVSLCQPVLLGTEWRGALRLLPRG